MSAAFLRLIQSGATAEVADAVETDPGLASARDPQGVSMLIWSVYYGQEMVRNFLLSRLAADGLPLDIFEAAATGDDGRLKALLQAEPELAGSFSGDGWTPLHLAAAFGTPETVSALLAAGASVDAFSRNPQQNQPLHAALALGKNTQTIRLLLDAGASVNSTQAGGFTPLFSAAIANRKDLVKMLLAEGADPHHKADQGKTAADFARERGHGDLAAWLESQPRT
ncbi:MAG: ankyrin repeat domain-containing protein [Terracidiphilus sp.]